MKEIQEQFNKVITYSQGIENPKTDELFADWAENKRKFIGWFGGKPIIELGNVTFELSEDAKEQKVLDFAAEILNDSYDLADFLIWEKDNFFNNKLTEPYTTREGKIIPKGMKIIRAFKYFIKENPKLLNKYQMKASELIQENKVNGVLCMSVHPLDYLSSSENTYNWRSCHSLDGGYRSGNLSYMADASTVVVYLRGEKETKLPHFPEDVPWNNKKWRMLLHFNNNFTLIFAGRQYPFFTSAVFDTLDKFIVPESENMVYTPWVNKYYTHAKLGDYEIAYPKRFMPLDCGPVPVEDMVNDCSQKLHYNDILYSNCYIKPYYKMALIKSSNPFENVWYNYMEKSDTVNVGHKVKCLDCGKHAIVSSEGTMRCFDCELEHGTERNENFDQCGCCGRRIYLNDDNTFWIESEQEYYCRDCAEDLFECDGCHSLYRPENLTELENGESLCPSCLSY